MEGKIERFREGGKIEIISRLLELTERQLEATRKEEWDKWESLFAQKEKIYVSLVKNPLSSLTQNDKYQLHLIKTKEAAIKGLLKRKKRKIINDLDQIKNVKRGLKGYRPSSSKLKLPRFLSKKI